MGGGMWTYDGAAIMAVKPVYRGKKKGYVCEVIVGANPLLAHDGYLIYDDAERAIEHINTGRLLGGWKKAKVDAVLAFLRKEVSG